MQEKCTIRGFLFGRLCEEFSLFDRIAGATVYVFPGQSEPRGGLTSLSNPDLKPQTRSIDEKELAAKTDQQAKGSEGWVVETDESGTFCINDDRYEGQAVDVYTCIRSVPNTGEDAQNVQLKTPQCLFLGTFEPVLYGDTYYLVQVIPAAVWCRIKRLADVWTIVGQVTRCENGAPLGEVRVKAFDTDFTQDDHLGDAVTNLQGFFRIDYLGAAYRQGTFIDVELFGGPDVYFHVESLDGTKVLIKEPRSKGRTKGRCNVGPCLCVNLCAELEDEDTPPIDVTAWTRIGSAFTVPDAGNLNSFDADGYAGTAKFALTGRIRMTGSIAYTPSGATPPGSGFVSAAGHPIRYRFLVSETPTSNTLPATPAGGFTRIVGAGPAADIALFRPVVIGEVVRNSPFKIIPVVATLDEVDAQGWLDLNQSILRVFMNPAEQNLGPAEAPLTPADMASFKFSWTNGALMAIDTRGLTNQSNVPVGSVTPGQPVAAADQMNLIEKVAFRFEVRAFNDGASTSTPMPGNGTQLDAAVVNNNVEVRRLAMKEHLASGSCTPLNGPVHVAYTVHHPHLASASITVWSNDFDPANPTSAASINAYSVVLNDPPRLSLSNNTDPTVRHLFNGNLLVPATDDDSTALKRCTYLVTLNTRLRLHTGDSADTNSATQTTFFLDV